MRVLVTGGAGFVGGGVARALLAGGANVTILDDFSAASPGAIHPGLRVAAVDIRDRAAVTATLEALRPEVVCHQAAQTSVPASTRDPFLDAEVNLIGTLNLLVAAAAAGVGRFVFASSGGAVFGNVSSGRRASPATPAAPASPYGCSKLAAEGYLAGFHRMCGLRFNILRYSNVYGPGQNAGGETGVVAIFAARALTGAPLRINGRRQPGDAGCVRDYVFLDDVVTANLRAIRGELEDPILNVCSGRGTSTRDLARRIVRLGGRRSPLEPAAPRRGDVEYSVLAPATRLGAPTPLDVGLRATLAWFEQEAVGSEFAAADGPWPHQTITPPAAMKSSYQS